MTKFDCQVCGAAFDVAESALAKYPGWKPKFCRAHSPAKKSVQKTKSRVRGSAREENLTRAQVLAKYTGGPSSGLFTDGSSVPNPGPGGWGVVWVHGGVVRAERHGESPDTTNNRMELMALLEAYKLLPEDAHETVHTDSRLCVDTITKWAPGWESKGWKRKTGPIKNLELIQELLALYRAHPNCPLQWIAAHSGNRWNEYADCLASAWQRKDL